jgi:uncharacterized membrane protein
MKYSSIDILLVSLIADVAVALAFIVPPENVPIRILTLPLVLVLPGYALTSALFPVRAPGIPERLVFSLGLSLVIVILGGLLLNLAPFGLSASSWAVLLGGITIGACAVAFVRRRRQSGAASGSSGIAGFGLTFRQWLLLGIAVVIVGEAIAVSVIGAERQPYPGFTQLWILPAKGVNAKNTVLLGVRNMENTDMNYFLDVNVDGKLVKKWPSIDLKQSENWETTLVIPQTTHVGSAMVEAMLYRTDAPTKIYRHVELWLGT